MRYNIFRILERESPHTLLLGGSNVEGSVLHIGRSILFLAVVWRTSLFNVPPPPPPPPPLPARRSDLRDGPKLFQGRMELDGWIDRGCQRDRRCTGTALGPRKRPVLAASSASVASAASLAPHTPGARPKTSCKRDDPWPASGFERGRRHPRVFSDFQVCVSSFCFVHAGTDLVEKHGKYSVQRKGGVRHLLRQTTLSRNRQ